MLARSAASSRLQKFNPRRERRNACTLELSTALTPCHSFLTLLWRLRPVFCYSISQFEAKAAPTFLFQMTFRYDCIIFEWSLLPLTTRQPYAASTASSNASRSKGTVSCALTTMRSRSRFSVAMTVFSTQGGRRGRSRVATRAAATAPCYEALPHNPMRRHRA